ncbi:S8 family serine peptidase [Anaerostipes caccae]|uniref:S8 family serine peptidase n=1 Tax=Anaerostipes caccae TaxID=105841 RepID=UPI0038D36C99
MQKKKIRRVLSFLLSTMMLCGMCLSPSFQSNVSAETGKNKNYIVVAKSKKAMKSVKAQYNSLIDEQKTSLLKEENIIVSKMTQKEANTIEKDNKVEVVEEDINVNASTTNEDESNKNVKVQKKSKGKDDFWNLKSIGVDEEHHKGGSKVKVALLDSGVDFQEGLDVKERVNLIADGEEISPLFEDETNHGTSIASLLISENENRQVKGINPNIELYSARILDRNKQAPVSRVIEGIHWAIDKNVKIISISFGMDQYSEALKQAIDEANAKGILVVAAAGNNGEKGTDSVQYPAAFENVVAVGSIDSQAKISDFSSIGKEVDVVAPGEAVRATGAFGETMVTSGTSMSVPHVVGVASLIWQKDLSKPKDFVSQLLEESAKPLGNKEKYGNGVVDYEYANNIYEQAKRQYSETKNINVEKNDSVVEIYNNFSDEAKVGGTWSGSNHQKYLTDKNVNLPVMKKGASYPDSKETDSAKIFGMTENPDFHGFYVRKNSNKENVNFLASYRFMIKIANAYGKGKTYTAVSRSDIPGLTLNSYNKIRSAMNSIQKKSFFKKYKDPNKKAFIFGIAMHTATDTFAHSTFEFTGGKWSRITHFPESTKPADNVKYQARRYTMAYRVERNNLYRYQGKRSDVAVCHDFHAAGDKNGSYYVDDTTNKYYRVCNISTYGSQVHISDVNVKKHYGMINVDRSNNIIEKLD